MFINLEGIVVGDNGTLREMLCAWKVVLLVGVGQSPTTSARGTSVVIATVTSTPHQRRQALRAARKAASEGLAILRSLSRCATVQIAFLGMAVLRPPSYRTRALHQAYGFHVSIDSHVGSVYPSLG